MGVGKDSDEPFGPDPTLPTALAAPPVLPAAGTATDASPATNVALRFYAARIEPDLDGSFLANKINTTIGAAAARAETDLHLTGCHYATSALLTTTPMQLTIPLNGSNSGVYEVKSDKIRTLYASNRMRMNMTASRVAVGIDGSIVNTMSGQASVSLDAIFETKIQKCSSVVPLVYANWGSFSSVVEISDATFVDTTTGDEIATVVFTDDDKFNAISSRAGVVLEQIYNDATKVREIAVFEPSKLLTKCILARPFGIDGTTYDLCASVISRPASHDHTTFESLAQHVMDMSLGFDEQKRSEFLAECVRPGMQASRWSTSVANAMSLYVCSICSYRIDGRTLLTPRGMAMSAAESWKAEASRTNCQSSDDCDGSMAGITSALHAAALVAADKELASTFPYTACMANAMAMHVVGGFVLAANAGHAGEAGKNVSAVAGHAVAGALPKSQVLNALVAGALSESQHTDSDNVAALIGKLKPMWLGAMFSDSELERMSITDRKLVTNYDDFISIHKGVPYNHLAPLAMEGTSPVAPSYFFSSDIEDRLRRQRKAADAAGIVKLLGPNVARTLVQLDVSATNTQKGHTFYSSMVEFMVSPHSPLFRNEALREIGFATAQFVLARPRNLNVAGASPMQLALNDYALLALWKLGSEDAAAMDTAMAEVQRNTLPCRGGPDELDEASSKIYTTNLARLRAVHVEMSTGYSPTSSNPKIQSIFAIGTLIHNLHAIDAFAQSLEAQKGTIAVSIVMNPMPHVLVNHKGEDVGQFVVVNVEQVV